MLKAEKDFEEFIELLNKHKIEYMIVGAYALALYAKPRNTGDLDIFIGRTESNAKLMLNVLVEFGFESVTITNFHRKNRKQCKIDAECFSGIWI